MSEETNSNKLNYKGILIQTLLLVIGVIGEFSYKPAKNIYTFFSIVLAFCFIVTMLNKTPFKPNKPTSVLFMFNLLFCVAFGKWWLAICWTIINIGHLSGMLTWEKGNKK